MVDLKSMKPTALFKHPKNVSNRVFSTDSTSKIISNRLQFILGDSLDLTKINIYNFYFVYNHKLRIDFYKYYKCEIPAKLFTPPSDYFGNKLFIGFGLRHYASQDEFEEQWLMDKLKYE